MGGPQPRPFQFSIARLMGTIAIMGTFLGVARLSGFEGDYVGATYLAAVLAFGAAVGTLAGGWKGAVVGTVASATLISPIPLLVLMGGLILQAAWRRRRRDS